MFLPFFLSAVIKGWSVRGLYDIRHIRMTYAILIYVSMLML